MQRMLMGKGGSKKLRDIEKVEGDDGEDEDDEDEDYDGSDSDRDRDNGEDSDGDEFHSAPSTSRTPSPTSPTRALQRPSLRQQRRLTLSIPSHDLTDSFPTPSLLRILPSSSITHLHITYTEHLLACDTRIAPALAALVIRRTRPQPYPPSQRVALAAPQASHQIIRLVCPRRVRRPLHHRLHHRLRRGECPRRRACLQGRRRRQEDELDLSQGEGCRCHPKVRDAALLLSMKRNVMHLPIQR